MDVGIVDIFVVGHTNAPLLFGPNLLAALSCALSIGLIEKENAGRNMLNLISKNRNPSRILRRKFGRFSPKCNLIEGGIHGPDNGLARKAEKPGSDPQTKNAFGAYLGSFKTRV